MKTDRWTYRNERTPSSWLAKLGEEFGEASQAFLKVQRKMEKGDDPRSELDHLADELAHLEFIAGQFRMNTLEQLTRFNEQYRV